MEVLRRVLQRCREYKLKMHPMKCAFGVRSGKFLGYLVNRQGMNVDPAKAKAVLDMPEPTSAKEWKSFFSMNWIFHLGNAKVDSPNGRKRVLKAPIVYVYGSINFEVERRSCQETSIPFRQVGKKKRRRFVVDRQIFLVSNLRCGEWSTAWFPNGSASSECAPP